MRVSSPFSITALLSLALVGCSSAALGEGPDLEAAIVDPQDDLAVAPDLKAPPKPPRDLTAEEPDDPSPDLAPQEDPLQPTTHVDDAALLDPNRVTMTGCGKMAAITPTQVGDFFPSGMGSWALAADVRMADFAAMQFDAPYRRCNPVTGCEKWVVTQNYADKFILVFAFDEHDELWLVQFTATGTFVTQRRATGSRFTMSLAVDGALPTTWKLARFAVDLADKGVCLESLVSIRPETTGTFESFYYAAFSRDHTTLPARPASEPVPAPVIDCDGVAATQPELASWFAPGKIVRSLDNETRLSVRRECHALTGCSKWVSEATPFFKTLNVVGSDIVLWASDPAGGVARDYLLTNSAFSSAEVAIVFTPSCARAVGHNRYPGKRNNQVEQVTAVRVPKP